MRFGNFFRLYFLLLILPASMVFTSCLQKGDMAIQQGSAYFQRKQFDLAETAFKMALDVECSYPKEYIYVLISNCYSQRGGYDGAIEWRNKALEIREDAENYVNLGLIYRLKNDETTAEQMYKKALELAPDDGGVYGSIASLYLSQDRIDEAIPLFEKCLELNPRMPVVYADLAVCYARKGRFDEAEEMLSFAHKMKVDRYDEFRSEIDALEKDAGYRREGV